MSAMNTPGRETKACPTLRTMPNRLQQALDSPTRTLAFAFVAWKLVLVLLAVGSPGLGYDTSTGLVLHTLQHLKHGTPDDSAWQYLVAKLTRWDAIYFVITAHRSYLFEQEWAFGWGWTRAISFLTTGLRNLGFTGDRVLEGLVAIVLANVSHLLSILVLYRLTQHLFPSARSRGLCLAAPLLHVISPAGLFLSAPYAESSCSFLTFSGCLLFAKSLAPQQSTTLCQDLEVFLSGVLFGLATTCRSNGILNGLLLIEEAVRVLLRFKHGFHVTTLRRLVATGLGGVCIGLGFLLPQYLAYVEYCTGINEEAMRPWCKKMLPSIYTFVQEHYWNVGLFRYWTVSNIPLFILAAPMFAIVTTSSKWAWNMSRPIWKTQVKQREELPVQLGGAAATNIQILRNLAISQLLIVLLTLTTAHVQIITRISSSYPVWIWYVSTLLQEKSVTARDLVVRFVVVYAVVQGGLFASFLPPA